MKKILTILLIVALMVPLAALTASAKVISQDLTTTLSTLETNEQVAVIVTLTDQADVSSIKGNSKAERRGKLIRELKGKADKSQKPVVSMLNNRGVKNIKKFWIFNGLAFSATADQIHDLANQPGIGSIRLDDLLKAPKATTTATATPEWNLVAVGAHNLWGSGFTGAGTVVASMDTGVDALHPDLAPQWRGGNNSWFDPNGEHATPYDSVGHGTQSMGLIVGGEAGGTAIGMAPGAQWISAKIFNDAGDASFSSIHQAFQWMLDPDGNPGTNDAPDVVNNSWGLSTNVNQCITEFQPDVQALQAADIGVVFSAGNEGPLPASSISPANYPESFAVGAIDSNFNIASSSSRGPSACDGGIFPQVAAPGINVRSADLTFGGIFPDSYANVSGTSFAAPHVTGSVALLLGAFPERTVAEIEQSLQETAVDLGQYGADSDFGNGMIDVLAAYNQLLSPGGCTDSDADGFFAEASCGTEVDCNDFDATINPAACDIKRDGIDQNCDGVDRSNGKSCPVIDSGDGGGGSTGGVEGKGNTCSDGLDNDGDGQVDCSDSDCSRNKQCR